MVKRIQTLMPTEIRKEYVFTGGAPWQSDSADADLLRASTNVRPWCSAPFAGAQGSWIRDFSFQIGLCELQSQRAAGRRPLSVVFEPRQSVRIWWARWGASVLWRYRRYAAVNHHAGSTAARTLMSVHILVANAVRRLSSALNCSAAV